MPKYQVVINAHYEEVYEVEAEDEKDALEKSVDADCIESTNVWNETGSIRQLPEGDPGT